MNDRVKVSLTEPREPMKDVTVHKMKKCKKDLAQENEKMDKRKVCDKLETVKEHG